MATDDIERAISAQAVSVARQINLSISGMLHGIGLGAGATNLEQTLNGISGQDYNTRLSVAREIDNVLSVRIGATLEGQGGRALVDQPYEIATLLLVPVGYFNARDELEPINIQIVTDTIYTDAETGQPLKQMPDAIKMARLDEAVTGAFRDGEERAAFTEAWMRIPEDKRRGLGRRLSEQAQIGKMPSFLTELREADKLLAKYNNWPVPDGDATWLANTDVVNSKLLWTRLAGVVGRSPNKSSVLQISNPAPLTIPAQTAVMYDDGKSSATVTLNEVGGNAVSGLISSLNWTGGNPNTSGSVVGRMSIDAVIPPPLASDSRRGFPDASVI